MSPKETPRVMAEVIELWQRGLREKLVHPLEFAAALNLDFLCIHPFRDGNGRTSRHQGWAYISRERFIEDNKERYEEVLGQSFQRWHEGKYDPWPAMNFLLYILKRAVRNLKNE